MNSILRKVGELGLNALAGHTMKFSGCTWFKIEFGKEKRQSGGIVQKGELHERNPCVLGFEEQPPEETSRQADCTSKVAWNLARQYASSKPKITTFYSPMKVPETQKIVWLFWIRKLQCTMHNAEQRRFFSSDTMDTLRRSKNTTSDLPRSRTVQINE